MRLIKTLPSINKVIQGRAKGAMSQRSYSLEKVKRSIKDGWLIFSIASFVGTSVHPVAQQKKFNDHQP